ncbi:MAG: sodium-dependent transporter [Bacteroidales bacterium]|nr:sodium-dependent transporter [Bacteroidales bacterium]
MAKKITFSSHFGTIAVVGGSVIGLGNIWRFPYLAGSNGGSAFIIVYIICSLMVAVPIMMSEFVIGRSTESNSFGAFKKLSNHKIWTIIGVLGLLTVFVIFSFYSVVAGWAISFFQQAITEGFAGKNPEIIQTSFTNYINSGWKPSIAAIIFICLTAGVVVGGIEKGIERINKFLMPLLVIILLVLFAYSTTLDGFEQSASFLLKPDFSKIGFHSILSAIGQAFFSMSLGMGCMITYGSYIKPETSLSKLTFTIALSDLSVALIAGFAIFPGVFTFGIEPTSGPTLVFQTLPMVFSKMFLGNIFGILFFFLVFIAAITSSVSMLEPLCLFCIQEFKISRVVSVLIICVFVTILAIICAYSQIEGSAIRLMGNNLFDTLNNFTDKISMPITALLIVIFIGWIANKHLFETQITNNGTIFSKGCKLYYFLVKFFVPVILLLFVFNMFGLL